MSSAVKAAAPDEVVSVNLRSNVSPLLQMMSTLCEVSKFIVVAIFIVLTFVINPRLEVVVEASAFGLDRLDVVQ